MGGVCYTAICASTELTFQPGSLDARPALTPIPLAHPDILRRIISFIPLGRLPVLMRVSPTVYDIAGPQLYHRLPSPSGLKLKRLQSTLARDKPARVFRLMRHTAIIHFTDGLRTTLLSAIERGDLVMPNIKHVIIDGLAISSNNIHSPSADNDRLLSASSGITLVCHADALNTPPTSRCWRPYLCPSVRNMVVLFRPGRCNADVFGSDAQSLTATIPSTIERLAVVLSPSPGSPMWNFERDMGSDLPLYILVSHLAYACLARAQRIVIAGSDRVDPAYWDSDEPDNAPEDGAARMSRLESCVRGRAIEWKEKDTTYSLWPEEWTEEDVKKHLERIEFVTWSRYVRGVSE
jgi:hypothetical protein